MNTNSEILIIVGGSATKLDPFREASANLKINASFASFSNLNFISDKSSSGFILKVGDTDIASYRLIYIRMVGRRVEDATLLMNYANSKGVKIIDSLYQNSLGLPSSISKALEMKKLIEAGIPFPQTLFTTLSDLKIKAPEIFGFNFVIKSTSGKKARDVWAPKSADELQQTIADLLPREKSGDRFFAQEIIKASQRIRTLLIGGRVVGAITRSTKYRKRFLRDKEFNVEPEKGPIIPIPDDVNNISISAARAVDLDIAGVDILKEDDTGKLYVIEVNAAPSWKLIAKDCHIIVEEEILKYLVSQI